MPRQYTPVRLRRILLNGEVFNEPGKEKEIIHGQDIKLNLEKDVDKGRTPSPADDFE
ncbi:hypothetical protein FGF1_33860 [Flavobacteriaceae bacterium GF1]